MNQAKLQEKFQNIQKAVLNATVTRGFLGRPISIEDLEERVGWKVPCDTPLLVLGKAKADDKAAKLPEAPISSKDLVL